MIPEFSEIDLESLGINIELEDRVESTTATIEKYYPQLESPWEIGEQQADTNGNPLSRTYSVLEFNNTNASVELVQLDYNSEEYEGNKYYRAFHSFIEYEYYSALGGEFDNFTKWERSINKYLQEIIYKHTLISESKWNREYIVITEVTDPIQLGQIINNKEYDKRIETGRSQPVSKEIEGRIERVVYESISIPYKRIIGAGKAVGIEIETDSTAKAYLKSSPMGQEREEVDINSIIVMTKPYIELEFNSPIGEKPTRIEVKYYGKILWRMYNPTLIDDEPDILVHHNSVPQGERYKPPGRNDLPDNFWNNTPNINNYEGFINRLSQEPTFN